MFHYMRIFKNLLKQSLKTNRYQVVICNIPQKKVTSYLQCDRVDKEGYQEKSQVNNISGYYICPFSILSYF